MVHNNAVIVLFHEFPTCSKVHFRVICFVELCSSNQIEDTGIIRYAQAIRAQLEFDPIQAVRLQLLNRLQESVQQMNCYRISSCDDSSRGFLSPL